MPLSGLLADWQLVGGWPSIFYVFGVIGTIWCIAFLIWVYEDPEQHPRITEDEKKLILSSLWGSAGISVSFFRISSLLINRTFIFTFNDKVEEANILFFFSLLVIASRAMEVYCNFATILGYLDGAYGSELWIRNINDPASNIHETNSPF